MKLASLLLPMALAGAPTVPVEQYRLPNGLTVVLSEDHRLPMVATEVLYLVGSSHERATRTGFAHLFEHLMFQGSQHFNDEYFGPFEPIGALINGTTNRDRTNYFERVPSNYAELPLWMESERMQYLLPALDQAKLDNQREVVKNERRQSYENQPYGTAWLRLGEMLYPEGHPYRHSPIGSHEHLTAATLQDVHAFFKQYYVPANAVLAVAGDFESAGMKAQIERYFGAIPGGERAAPPKAQLPVQTAIKTLVVEDDVELPRSYWAWHTPALFEAGDAELDLLSNVLTEGKSSRLHLPLVYKDKVAKEIHAYQVSQRLSGFYVIEATAAPGRSLDELQQAVMAALTAALATPPSDSELLRAKNAYKKSFYERIEGVDSRASLLASYYLFTGEANYIERDLERYVAATPDGVHAAASKWLGLNNFVRIDFVPRAKQEEGSQ